MLEPQAVRDKAASIAAATTYHLDEKKRLGF